MRLGIFHLEKYSNRDLWNIPLAETRLPLTYSWTAKKPGTGPCLPIPNELRLTDSPWLSLKLCSNFPHSG